MYITFAILAITIVFLIFGRLRSDLVALLSLIALILAGVLTVEQALSGFSNSTVLMVAALFVVAEGLSRTGVTAWLSQLLLKSAGKNHVRLLIILMAGAALLSAFISNTGTVATLLPAVAAAAWKIGAVPSMFLMPLAFAANTGGLITLTGTPPNIVVANTLSAAGFEPFGYFEYALVGVPLLFVAITFMVLLGRRLLPERRLTERPLELDESMSALAEDYVLQGDLYRLRVRYSSRLVGLTLEEAALGRDFNVAVLRIDPTPEIRVDGAGWSERSRQQVAQELGKLQPEGEQAMPKPDSMIRANDVLLVKGGRRDIDELMLRFNVAIQPVLDETEQLSEMLLTHEVGLAEVLIAPRSAYIGRTIAQGQISAKYGIQILRIRRQDRPLDPHNVRLAFGDALLVRGTWENIEILQNERRNFVVVGSPDVLARQVVRLSGRSVVAAAALLGMIALMVSGLVPTVTAALIAAGVMVLGGCLNMGQAYRAISWGSVVLIAAMIPLSIALQETGGGEFIASGLVRTLGSGGPMVLTAGIFLLTSAFSQVMSNTATTILFAPIVLQAALDLNLSPYPLLMAVAISASTAFLTPIGTTTNMMVASPGGYRFTDFLKVGSFLVFLFLIVSLLLVPIFWPF